jgi:hypothetical protein
VARVRAYIEALAPTRRTTPCPPSSTSRDGDTAIDSHLNMPSITVDRDRLDRVELVPFKAAIDAG